MINMTSAPSQVIFIIINVLIVYLSTTKFSKMSSRYIENILAMNAKVQEKRMKSFKEQLTDSNYLKFISSYK